MTRLTAKPITQLEGDVLERVASAVLPERIDLTRVRLEPGGSIEGTSGGRAFDGRQGDSFHVRPGARLEHGTIEQRPPDALAPRFGCDVHAPDDRLVSRLDPGFLDAPDDADECAVRECAEDDLPVGVRRPRAARQQP